MHFKNVLMLRGLTQDLCVRPLWFSALHFIKIKGRGMGTAKKSNETRKEWECVTSSPYLLPFFYHEFDCTIILHVLC